uniref:Uncharacterized protein n=1 Tax=Trichobilharzia regenti TaxID=157069 RepID=A0AA85IUP1_TRIRE|nr:unnamed protein product [Trichobilharzia regenti]
MSVYPIPSNKIPAMNMYQEINDCRIREFNDEVDITFPPYIVDKRILKCIEYNNLNYLQAYIKKCPYNIERYFYSENIPSIDPILRKVIISNLLGYAILYRANECLQYLLTISSNPFQSAFFIEYSSKPNGINKKLFMYEAPTVILLANSIQEKKRDEVIKLLMSLRSANVELHLPIALRQQQMEPPNEPVSLILRFIDTWECLEKELEKQDEAEASKNKELLKELKSVYRAEKFDKMKNE